MKRVRRGVASLLLVTGLAAALLVPTLLEGTTPVRIPAQTLSVSGNATAQRTALMLPASIGRTKVTPGAKLTGPSAARVLKTLPVKGKAPATGYQRNAKFGNGFKDFNRNKCDERQDTLTRDMSRVKYKDRKHCQVASGRLDDAYTGRELNWRVKAGSVDIDHVVALKNAWISGGQKLSRNQRQALANDPLNLMASAASANRSKGDRNAAEWLPGNRRFRCQYIATQISVKHKYALSVTAAEKAGMTRVLRSCPKQRAAKSTPIKPAGKASTSAGKQVPKKNTKTTSRKVHPGAFCSPRGTRGVGKTNAKVYTCTSSRTDTRARWRR